MSLEAGPASLDIVLRLYLQIYVTWTGTDAKGNYLISAANRFSQFRSYSLSSYYDQAVNAFKNNIIDIGDVPTPAPTTPAVNSSGNSTRRW